MKIAMTIFVVFVTSLVGAVHANAAGSSLLCRDLFLPPSVSPDGAFKIGRNGDLIQVESLSSGRVIHEFSNPIDGRTTTEWHWSKNSKVVSGLVLDGNKQAISGFALDLDSGVLSKVPGKLKILFDLIPTRYSLHDVEPLNQTTALVTYRYINKYGHYDWRKWRPEVFQVINLQSGKVVATTNWNARKGSPKWAGRKYGAFDSQLDPYDDSFRLINHGNFREEIAKMRSPLTVKRQFSDLSGQFLFTIYGDGAIEILRTSDLKLVQELPPPFKLKPGERGEWIDGLRLIRAPDQKNIYLLALIAGRPRFLGRVGGGDATTARDVVFKIALGDPASIAMVGEVIHESDVLVTETIPKDVPFIGGEKATRIIYSGRDLSSPRFDLSDDGKQLLIKRKLTNQTFDLD